MARLVEDGRSLYPVVVQHAVTLQVLMMAYADDDALRLTRQTGFAHFYSRSRRSLWKKGETSGHTMRVTSILEDCDQDSFVYLAVGDHPACHTNRTSCFVGTPRASDPAHLLERIIQQRLEGPHQDKSYTAQLLQEPLERLLKKVGEEAIEVIVAANEPGPEHTPHLIHEATDLLYHLSVLLRRDGISYDEIQAEIVRRQNPED